MNNIIFRGKRVDNGEWVYGSLLLVNNTAYIYPYNYTDLNDTDFGCVFVEVDPKTVGQYANIKDKNKKKVFEGDVLAIDNGQQIRKVVVKIPDIYFSLVAGGDIIKTNILGNVFDNPELTGGEK